MFDAAARLLISIGIPTKEAEAEIETHLKTAMAKIIKCSMQFKVVQTFLFFLFISFNFGFLLQ